MGLLRHRDDGPAGERFLMREKLLSIGDDYWIENDRGERAYKVDGKAFRVRETFVLEDTSGAEVARIQERTGHEFGPDALQALFDLGATVCLARIPRCERCPLAERCPSRGRRYEPLRKQSRFEGSFRQRRAALLRHVADAPRPLAALDREAVDSLLRDGLVVIEAELVALPV